MLGRTSVSAEVFGAKIFNTVCRCAAGRCVAQAACYAMEKVSAEHVFLSLYAFKAKAGFCFCRCNRHAVARNLFFFPNNFNFTVKTCLQDGFGYLMMIPRKADTQAIPRGKTTQASLTPAIGQSRQQMQSHMALYQTFGNARSRSQIAVDLEAISAAPATVETERSPFMPGPPGSDKKKEGEK